MQAQNAAIHGENEANHRPIRSGENDKEKDENLLKLHQPDLLCVLWDGQRQNAENPREAQDEKHANVNEEVGPSAILLAGCSSVGLELFCHITDRQNGSRVHDGIGKEDEHNWCGKEDHASEKVSDPAVIHAIIHAKDAHKVEAATDGHEPQRSAESIEGIRFPVLS